MWAEGAGLRGRGRGRGGGAHPAASPGCCRSRSCPGSERRSGRKCRLRGAAAAAGACGAAPRCWSSAGDTQRVRRVRFIGPARLDRRQRYLGDGVDVAVGQQLLLQGAQQLVQVSRLAAVRRRGALLQLVAVLLQFAQRLVLQRTENRTAVTRRVLLFSLHSQRGGLPGPCCVLR